MNTLPGWQCLLLLLFLTQLTGCAVGPGVEAIGYREMGDFSRPEKVWQEPLVAEQNPEQADGSRQVSQGGDRQRAPDDRGSDSLDQLLGALLRGDTGLEQDPLPLANALIEARIQANANELSRQKAEESLAGFNFGTGLGATFDMHSGSRISSARVVDEGAGPVVRADADSDASLGLVLETHYFWLMNSAKTIGFGPFVAIRTGDNDPVAEAGLGLMVGLRRSKKATDSFNIGVGIMVDPDAKVLSDGFEANLPAPTGATEVAFRTEERFSLAVIFSYTF